MKKTGSTLMRTGPVSGSTLIRTAVESGNIFNFPDGIPAFEDAKQFVLVHKASTTPFVYLQCLDPSDLCFVCVDPFAISDGYGPNIGAGDAQFLGLNGSNRLLLLSIVTVTSDVRDMTANLQGPIVINLKTSTGKQVICDQQGYEVRCRIWDAVTNAKREDPECSMQTVAAM